MREGIRPVEDKTHSFDEPVRAKRTRNISILMKKRLFLATLISICALGAFLVSCDKDDDDSASCTCVEYETDSNKSYTQALDPASFGATNCSDLAVKLNMNSDGDFYYECH